MKSLAIVIILVALVLLGGITYIMTAGKGVQRLGVTTSSMPNSKTTQHTTSANNTTVIGSTTTPTPQKGNATSNGDSTSQTLTYPIVGSGQALCFDNTTQIPCPLLGQAFYGQDAQEPRTKARYTFEDNGRVVYDNITGLYWMRGPSINSTANDSDKMTYPEALAYVQKVNAMNYGGYNDWRIPTLKQLYSLYQAYGTDPGNDNGSTSYLTPFINTTYFNVTYGSGQSASVGTGERIIDAQYLSSTNFIGNPSTGPRQKIFGVNFADGRIKGYGQNFAGAQNYTFTWFVMLVRGNPAYGTNKFVNSGNGTVTDLATGLMWSRNDSGHGMTWEQALSYVQVANKNHYLGYDNWRLPSIKELQSISNYSNAPEYNAKPAINTNFFNSTQITNENGTRDYGYYWSSTTHENAILNGAPKGNQADYIAFGEALGWAPAGAGPQEWIDFHGAGAQRSDSKTPAPLSYTITRNVTKNGVTYVGYSFGPEGDAVRGEDFVRLVRNATT